MDDASGTRVIQKYGDSPMNAKKPVITAAPSTAAFVSKGALFNKR